MTWGKSNENMLRLRPKYMRNDKVKLLWRNRDAFYLKFYRLEIRVMYFGKSI